MKHKVLIIDTSIMCVWLRVSGKESAGKDSTSIVDVAQYYSSIYDFEVEIFTSDSGLKNWEYRIATQKQEKKTLRRNRKY